jgi:hypothetical protein
MNNTERARELGPDGKEWAKTEAGYAHVDSMLPRADGENIGPFWYGWALREAFVAGAEWQEARAVPQEEPTDNWQQYAKDGETAQRCIERHRSEQDALLNLLSKEKARLHWLHSPASHNVDGYEWGIYRVKYDEHGQMVECLQTFSDFSDLDAAMSATPAEDLHARAVLALGGKVEREHIASAACWCQPTVEYRDPDTGVAVIVHKEMQ